jgi:Ino eighty subunit 1
MVKTTTYFVKSKLSYLTSSSGRSGSRLKSKHLQEYCSDTDLTRSVSPPRMNINNLLNNEDAPSPVPPQAPLGKPKGPGRGNWGPKHRAEVAAANAEAGFAPSTGTRQYKSRKSEALDQAASAIPHGYYIPLNGSEPNPKRHRPQTAHQAAVQEYRMRRVEYILDRKIRNHYKVAKKHRSRDGAMARAWLRCKMMPDGYDTDEDIMVQAAVEEGGLSSYHGEDGLAPVGGSRNGNGRQAKPTFVGLLPMPLEPLDYGEEAHARLQIMRRAIRRLGRWETGAQPIRKRKHRDSIEDERPGPDRATSFYSTTSQALDREDRGENGVQRGRRRQRAEDDLEADDMDMDATMEDMDDTMGGGDYEGGDEDMDDADRDIGDGDEGDSEEE